MSSGLGDEGSKAQHCGCSSDSVRLCRVSEPIFLDAMHNVDSLDLLQLGIRTDNMYSVLYHRDTTKTTNTNECMALHRCVQRHEETLSQNTANYRPLYSFHDASQHLALTARELIKGAHRT